MKEYVNEIRSISKIGRILEVSIVSSIILILLDRVNIVTKLLSNNFTMVISILTLGYIIFWLGCFTDWAYVICSKQGVIKCRYIH